MSTIKIQINGEEVNLSNREEELLKYTKILLNYLIGLGNRELKSQDNLDFLKKFEKKIQEAKEQEKKGLWRPKEGERYSFLSSDGVDSVTWYEDSCDCSRLDRGIFKTEEEAIDADNKRKALTRIKDYIAREGIEREKDWFYGEIIYDSLRMLGFSAEVTEKIIKACSSDLKILFGI